ncbi:MAG: cell division protein ZapA [Pseudomonadota bacterium]
MSPTEKDRLIEIRIFGQTYKIRSREEEIIKQVAHYLNQQMEELKKNSQVLNVIDLAVMVAFKAGSDYLQAQEDFSRLRAKIEADAETLATRIEHSLNPG